MFEYRLCWTIKLRCWFLDEVHEIILLSFNYQYKAVTSSACQVHFLILFYPWFKSSPRCFLLMEIAPHSTPSSWDLLFCVAQHSESISMTDWSLYMHYNHCFPCLLLQKVNLCPVYLGSQTALCICGHSKKSTKISWINKWNRKYCCLCMQIVIFLNDVFPILFCPYIIFNHVFFCFYLSHLQNLGHIMQHLGELHVISLNPPQFHDILI